MAKRTASAKKQARAGVRRSARNRGVRSEVKTLIVKARRGLASSSSASSASASSASSSAASASEGLAAGIEAVRSLDRAAAKGILHPNNAARRKSRLARQMAKLAAAAAAEQAAAAAPAKAASEARRGRGLRLPGRS